MKSKILIKNGREYEIYSNGKIYAMAYTDARGHKRGRKELSGSRRTGYLIVQLGTGVKCSAHRLTAEAYLANYSEGLRVDHIDGDRTNNNVNNLRMVTAGENSRAYQRPRGGTVPHYRGVSIEGNRFRAAVNTGGKHYFLGNHSTAELAARAYDEKAVQLGFLSQALNFPK